ncbi:MAG: hypothetical protein H7274_16135, partial [Rhodoferax sp.]|nr:hypothetical protein [Rhodoferax sp.]
LRVIIRVLPFVPINGTLPNELNYLPINMFHPLVFTRDNCALSAGKIDFPLKQGNQSSFEWNFSVDFTRHGTNRIIRRST